MRNSESFDGDPAINAPSYKPAHVAATRFTGMSLSGATCSAAASAVPARRLEAYGDSISCGFGNLASSGPAGQATCALKQGQVKVSCPRMSWVAQLADAFGAELALSCISGIGLCKNTLNLLPHNPYNLSFFMDRTIPFDDSAAPFDKYDAGADFGAVVFNLGTNDYDLSAGAIAPSEAQFEAAYVAFVVRAMRRHDPRKTGVLLTCGPMTNRFCSYVDNVRAALQARGFAAQYVDLSLPESPFPLKGCIDHPSVAEDTQCKNLAVVALRNLTGWS